MSYYEEKWQKKLPHIIEDDFQDSYTDDDGKKVDVYKVWVYRDPEDDDDE